MLSAAAAIVLVPPVNLVALALAGVLLGRRRLAGVALALALLLALPLVADTLMTSLETGLPAGGAGPPPQAIVILGGDVRAIAGPPGELPGPLTLARLQGGAALARAAHLPVLVTGGIVDPDGPPVAEVMAASLAQDFATQARWIEPRSATTWENARFSAAMLRPAGITRVYVVTHAWHMRRALIAFADTGLAVTPAPLPRDRPPRLRLRAFLPQVGAWRKSYWALHEWIGCAWYEVRRVTG